jgi:tetratricopeptide (TPR) repeat protein
MPEQHRTIPWKKWILLAIAVFAALVGASYLVYTALGSGRWHPMALLALAAALSIALPMVRANLFPSEKDCAAEYAFHEQRLEKDILQQISDGLGPETVNRLFAAPEQYAPTAADDLRELLSAPQVRNDPSLNFVLLLALARLYEKSGDPQAAVPLLQSAVAIQPRHFLARMHLAGNFEWMGDRVEACRHYRWLEDHARDLSKAMQKLVSAKLETCREH